MQNVGENSKKQTNKNKKKTYEIWFRIVLNNCVERCSFCNSIEIRLIADRMIQTKCWILTITAMGFLKTKRLLLGVIDYSLPEILQKVGFYC